MTPLAGVPVEAEHAASRRGSLRIDANQIGIFRVEETFDPATEVPMNISDIYTVARHMYDAQGSKAIAEAAQKAASFEKAGDEPQAKFWRRVENALLQMRGPRES